MADELTMFIDGKPVEPVAAFDVVNPATAEVAASAPDCSSEQLDAAMRAAQQSFAGWASDRGARREALLLAADAVDAAVDRIASVLTMEQGKPTREAAYETSLLAKSLRYFADATIPDEVMQDDERAHAAVVCHPVGPVAAITAWNFPLALAGQKLGPALATGNTVVLKPSPYTPLSTLLAGAVIAEQLPPGVLNVVSGGDELGAWMTGHPVPRKVSFTGSTATGRLVAAACARDFKRVTLELGGNDAAILLDDVDVQRMAKKLFWGAFSNNGQICSAIKRVYVPWKLYRDVVDALAAIAGGIRVGDGAEPDTQLGPLNNEAQLDIVERLTVDALEHGASAMTGGRRGAGPGYFFEPTIVAGAEDGMALVDQEQFGPVLPVIPYDTLEDAIARANGTEFGLGASLWSSDEDRAAALAARVQAGTVWINSHLVVENHLSFGGLKNSGIGSENGLLGMLAFTEPQTVYRRHG